MENMDLRNKTTKESLYLDKLDERLITTQIRNSINVLYGKIAQMVNFKYNLLIYRLIMKDIVNINKMEELTGLSKQRLYQIVKSFQEKEIERQEFGEAGV